MHVPANRTPPESTKQIKDGRVSLGHIIHGTYEPYSLLDLPTSLLETLESRWEKSETISARTQNTAQRPGKWGKRNLERWASSFHWGLSG
ncbi:MAG: hypothetical protein Q9169_001128 [Polycauliona sp. 2 TL-2023]